MFECQILSGCDSRWDVWRYKVTWKALCSQQCCHVMIWYNLFWFNGFFWNIFEAVEELRSLSAGFFMRNFRSTNSFNSWLDNKELKQTKKKNWQRFSGNPRRLCLWGRLPRITQKDNFQSKSHHVLSILWKHCLYCLQPAGTKKNTI